MSATYLLAQRSADYCNESAPIVVIYVAAAQSGRRTFFNWITRPIEDSCD